jgi:hypothetical protein
VSEYSPNEYLSELKARLPGMTLYEVRRELRLQYLRTGSATFDTRPLTAVKARLAEALRALRNEDPVAWADSDHN